MMTPLQLNNPLGGMVAIDACAPCQIFWFDRHESLKLAPASTLTLFKMIGERARAHRAQIKAVLRCPRCTSVLKKTRDRQRATTFEYSRCDQEHGRLITFFNFLREKDFIKPLTQAQINEMKENIQILNCSNCGASIDLVKSSVCPHCGSPLSMLDMKQADRLIGQLRTAAEPKPVDPNLPLRLAEARAESEKAFVPDAEWWQSASLGGLVEAGLVRLFGHR